MCVVSWAHLSSRVDGKMSSISQSGLSPVRSVCRGIRYLRTLPRRQGQLSVLIQRWYRRCFVNTRSRFSAVMLVIMLALAANLGVPTKDAEAAGRWCRVRATKVFVDGFTSPTDPNVVLEWRGRNLGDQIAAGNVYTYFNNEWIGLNYHGYGWTNGKSNRWGVPSWMPLRYPRTWNRASQWRIDFWSPDGKCR